MMTTQALMKQMFNLLAEAARLGSLAHQLRII
jgi:hypothetical protein